ncbi:MAG: UpxY family transcription antiterminator [Rikenellaceae bacterium]
MIDYSDHGIVWYAMKTVYKKELQAKEYLDARNIENFLPMVKDISIKRGRKQEVLKPAVHNLIFIKTDLAGLNDIKISLNYLHNKLMTIEAGVSAPIIVPTKQMELFIYAMTSLLDKITYIDLSTTQLIKGTPVRIIDGDFKGFEGELQKTKGKRSRTVHVVLQDLAGFTCEVEASDIEKI